MCVLFLSTKKIFDPSQESFPYVYQISSFFTNLLCASVRCVLAVQELTISSLFQSSLSHRSVTDQIVYISYSCQDKFWNQLAINRAEDESDINGVGKPSCIGSLHWQFLIGCGLLLGDLLIITAKFLGPISNCLLYQFFQLS